MEVEVLVKNSTNRTIWDAKDGRVFVCRAPGRLQNGPSDSLDVLWCSERSVVVLFFFRHTSRSSEVLDPQLNGFSARYSVPRGDMVASTEWTLHRYDSDFAKSRFRRQMRAALWTTPSLRLGRVVTGTSRLPAPFEPNPTLLRPPLPSQCPTESREGILHHPVLCFCIRYTVARIRFPVSVLSFRNLASCI